MLGAPKDEEEGLMDRLEDRLASGRLPSQKKSKRYSNYPDVEHLIDKMDEGVIRKLDTLAKEKVKGQDRTFGVSQRFLDSLQLAARVAFWCAFAAFAPPFFEAGNDLAVVEILPPMIAGYMRTIIVAIVYTAWGNVATTISFAVHGMAGTVLALVNAFILTHLPAAPSKHPYIATINFGLLTIFLLFINIPLNVQIFALSWSAYFCMVYAHPEHNLDHFMEFEYDSEMIAVFIVQLLGCCFAILATLLPYPITAFSQASAAAAKTSKSAGDLLIFVSKYYCGQHRNMSLNVWTSQLKKFHELTMTLESAVSNAWWEGFDFGNRGRSRLMMSKQVGLLRRLIRQLEILKICAETETFEEPHSDLMGPIKDNLLDFVCANGELCMEITYFAADGSIGDEDEKQLNERLKDIARLREEMMTKWTDIRKKNSPTGTGLKDEVRTESFFVYQVLRFSQNITTFAELTVKNKDEKSPNYVLGSFKGFFDKSVLFDRTHQNFVLRNSLAGILCFLFGIYRGFDILPAGYMTLMLSHHALSALQGNLNRIQGTVLGILTGNILFYIFHSCNLRFLRTLVLFLYETFTVFIYFYSAEFSKVGGLLAVFGGKLLVQHCKNELSAEHILQTESGAYHQFEMLADALFVITVIDLLLLPKPASVYARDEILKGMSLTFDSFRAFLGSQQGLLVDPTGDLIEDRKKSKSYLTKLADEFDAHMDKAETYATEADKEPRWHKAAFKPVLYHDISNILRKVQNSSRTYMSTLLTPGAEKVYTDIIVKCQSYKEVIKDLTNTMDLSENIVKQVLDYELDATFDDPRILKTMTETRDLDKVESVPKLTDELIKVYSAQENKQKDLKMDETGILCSSIEMLERTGEEMGRLLIQTLEEGL